MNRGAPSRRLDEILSAARDEVQDVEFTALRERKRSDPDFHAVGCFPVWVPHEVVHAAGALPVAVWGGGDRIEIERADARVQSFICSISRSTLELGLTDRLDFLDGMLFGSLCDVARNLSGVWARNFPDQYVDYLHYPQNLASPLAPGYLREDLMRLARELGGRFGVVVDDERLQASIELYERLRARLRALADLRSAEPWRLSLEELQVLVRAAGRRDPAEHLAVLDEVLALLPEREVRRQDGIRVVLEGSFCEQPSLELLRAFDDAHCFVVDSDLARGLRFFREPLPPDDDPWRRLVDGFLHHAEASIVRHVAPHERTARLLERIEAADADGVVFCTAKFCEPAFYDFVLHKRALEERKVPFMAVEFEEKMSSFESLRTQAETFVESILFFSEEVVG